MKDSQRARVGKIRIFGAQDRDVAIGLRVFAEKDRGGARRVYPRRVTRVGEKCDVTVAGLVEAGRPVYLYVFVLSVDTRAG
jgi:hypothetical protein